MKKFLFLLTLLAVAILSYTESFAAPPTVQAKYLAFSNLSSSGVTVHWTRGNGTNRIVVIRTDNNWTATDAILTTGGPIYTDANGNLSSAPQVGSTGSYVIDVMGTPGTSDYARQTTLSGLAAGTTYYVKVYEFNVSGSNWDYNNSSADNNPRSFRTTSSYSGSLPSGLNIAPWSEGGRLYWTDGTGAAGYLLSVYNNSSSSWAFQNRDIGKPTSQQYFVFGLNNNRSYTFYLYAYDASGNVSSTYAFVTQTTLANPSISSASYDPGHGSSPYYNNVGIGCSIVVTVTATNGQLGLLTNGTQTINGVDVTSTFTDKRDGTYTLTYTVASGDPNINDQSQDLPLSFNFQDGNNITFASTYTGSGNNLSAPGVDQTPPYVSSIVRQSPSGQCTNVNSVTFRVTFNEAVNTSSVSSSDFTVTGVSGSGSVGTITSVTPVFPSSGGASQYDVTVDVIGINREIRLDFTGSVNDMAYGCPNASTTTYTSGETYYVDHTNPSGTITTPANAACYRSATMPSSFSGSASDSWVGGAPCGLNLVEVSLWRDVNNDGSFTSGVDYSWNGSSWVTSQTWNNATGTTTWSWTHGAGATFTDGKHYVQIRVTDAAGNQWTMPPSHYFIYDNTAPSGGSITNPTSSGCYKGGDIVNIQWNNATDPNLSNTVNIEYYNGSSWVIIVSNHPISGSSGNYNWTVPNTVNTNSAQIRITFSDCAGNTHQILSPTFIIDNTAPTNTSAPTVPSTCLIAGQNYNITWTPGNISDPNFSSISLYYYNGSTLQLIQSGLANSGSYTWAIPSGVSVCGGNAYVVVRAIDCAGNSADATSGNFTIDNLSITAQPQDGQICSTTGSETFSVTATSSCATPTYQWEYSQDNSTWNNVSNGTPTNATYSGSNSSTLTVTSNSPGITTGTYYYRCVITSGCGSTITSNSAQLNVVPALSITSYPSNPTYGIIGSSLSVSVSFTGGSPSSKRWYLFRDDDGPGGSNPTLEASGTSTSPASITITSNVTCSTYGQYFIYIADDCDSLTSGTGYFTVYALAPEPTQVTNISGGRTRTTISLIWTSGDGMGRLIAATQGSTSYSGTIPSDGSVNTGANSYWPSAAPFGTNTRLLYNGTGSSAYITGLAPSTWYAFRAFEYNYNTGCSSTSYNYNTTTNASNPKAIKTTARDVEDEEVVRTSNFAVTPIWPNPVEDVLQFDLIPMKQANFRIEIVAMDGRTLFTHEYSYDNVATTVMIHLDRKLFAPGAYMLRVSALGETLQQPFIFMP
ncbi:MAG: hypothetical protein CH6_3737 [Candidatus Kapaibacterium sp.]|nr:MAG: hypothetical protein CH6_3737 [Candidatus Kapabacteria bacterium]